VTNPKTKKEKIMSTLDETRPAYFISFVQFQEPERFAEYAQLMFPALMKYNALPIAHIDPAGVTNAHTKAEVVEGTWPGITTVIQFPSRAKLEEFYNSAEYKKASEFRTKVAKSNIALVDQFSWPPSTNE
jgi:uncharacterized protein (DUF1330 family)